MSSFDIGIEFERLVYNKFSSLVKSGGFAFDKKSAKVLFNQNTIQRREKVI